MLDKNKTGKEENWKQEVKKGKGRKLEIKEKESEHKIFKGMLDKNRIGEV